MHSFFKGIFTGFDTFPIRQCQEMARLFYSAVQLNSQQHQSPPWFKEIYQTSIKKTQPKSFPSWES